MRNSPCSRSLLSLLEVSTATALHKWYKWFGLYRAWVDVYRQSFSDVVLGSFQDHGFGQRFRGGVWQSWKPVGSARDILQHGPRRWISLVLLLWSIYSYNRADLRLALNGNWPQRQLGYPRMLQLLANIEIETNTFGFSLVSDYITLHVLRHSLPGNVSLCVKIEETIV